MRYLIIFNNEAFYTDFYKYENHYQEGMIVIDKYYGVISFDGINWSLIEFDKL